MASSNETKAKLCDTCEAISVAKQTLQRYAPLKEFTVAEMSTWTDVADIVGTQTALGEKETATWIVEYLPLIIPCCCRPS